MSEETPRKLTVDDPVDLEGLERFNKLESARHEVALRLLEIEQERVRLLGAAHEVDKQTQRLFEKILLDRGLKPNSPVDINSTTGKITVRTPPKPEEPPPQEPEPEPPAG
jgi:hypothetical protein